MMPVMDGYEAILKLRVNKSTSAVPVLALTALAMKEDIDRIRSSGFDDYLIKPFHIEELFNKMKNLMEGTREKGTPKHDTLIHDDTSDRIYLESLKEAIKRIEKHYLPLWQQANDLKEYKSIRMFADAIHAIGNELDIKLLVDYGDKLILFCDNYDIEKIDLSLADFPEYLKKMKEIVTNDE
jgi:CheY-like chemotaxis protein